ncbi:response regulator [Subsaxibacter sp. CAU 1640]|uniref:response regulator n=1 Tax=Subsaxibacter sp. CAU 1640 TaxID=2933271 RepID=UPI002004D6F4|nr:response regulator [Subsaxibacter sp. CAU 1640]MCK7589638.1 response regulator [Subsaxibacter sp. CAU 1640]
MDKVLNLLLADDDVDDCDFFKDALEEMDLSVNFSTVSNGVELMALLRTADVPHPNLLFLDLNMPKKSGMECIEEIKTSDAMRDIPIVVFSTSMDAGVVDKLYNLGAHYYIQKPGEFKHLKAVIKKAITSFTHEQGPQPSKEQFIIQP